MKNVGRRWFRHAAGCALSMGALCVSASYASAQAVPADDAGFIVARPEALAEMGGRQVTLLGSTREPGLYVIRITWEPGSGSRPHLHDQGRLITVLEGTWYVSTGPASDIYDPDNMVAVGPGTFIYEPAGGHHYDMAKDERVVVQITGMGPVSTTSIPQPDADAGG